MNRSEIWRLEKYLRNLFRLDTITVAERPNQADSVEVHVAGEFIGIIFKDEEDGDISYAFQMAILEICRPLPPAARKQALRQLPRINECINSSTPLAISRQRDSCARLKR